MPITTEKYDQLKIDKLKHLLTELSAKGQARPFEIFVDGLKVVSKTEEVKEFENYEYYINEDTEKIRILIYYSLSSPRNDQYVYYLQHRGKADKPLNGLGDLDGIIQEKLEARDREHEARLVKQELEEIKKQLEEAEQYAEQLEQQLEQANSNKHKLGKLDLVELGGLILERIALNNPTALQKVGLGGLVAPADPAPAVEPVEASFSKQQQHPEENADHITLLQQLEAVFDEAQLEKVMLILRQFAMEPSHLQTVADLLNIDQKNTTT